jgi:hypothetical protein
MAITKSQDLHNTLLKNTHIKKVHFDGAGNHYFHVHEHKNDDGEVTGKYGWMSTDTKFVERTLPNGKVEGKYKIVHAPNEETKIVNTLDRDTVLRMPIDGDSATQPAAKDKPKKEKEAA